MSDAMDEVECVVVGAGVVGLAVARALAMAGREVIILEAEDAIGTHTSSRNSEVIHAGIYYPPGSLKAELCVAGKHALYRHCETHGVPFRRCGKLIVATHEDHHAELAALKRQAEANGVDDLQWLTEREVAGLEPAVRCIGALWSPSTGIIDSHGYMLSLLGDAEAAGAVLALRSKVARGRAITGGIELEAGGGSELTLRARCVVNAAGFSAQRLARSIAGLPAEAIPPGHLAKGTYFTLRGRSPFSRLVYPIPEQAGLGVHVTLDLGGQARFGPDVEWVDGVDYSVDPHRAERFYDAIRRYWPELPDDALVPAYAGIRPKIQGPGEPARDFMIQGPDSHGVQGLVNLFGIESPGLTASLAIAGRVSALLGQRR
jgi:L-2-hydroxyglutarate oxidase LhgO